MAIQGKVVSVAVKSAVGVLSDEEKRKKLVVFVGISFISILGMISIILEVISNPVEFLASNYGWSKEQSEEVSKIKEEAMQKLSLDTKIDSKDITHLGEFPYPITGEFRISSPFGFRSYIAAGGRRINGMHHGVDFVGQWHTPIISIADGEVIFSGKQRGYGNCILIRHDNFYTFYAHLSKRYAVANQEVKQYDVIGLEGGAKSDEGSGESTGHHLHFEIRMDGTKKTVVDPIPYLTKKKEKIDE